ncbi:MAG: alkaline phosphatase [Candidatus Competibacteraceae bacterium]|nr:alkaline phosphatase [Candidatus Competibacteraceae bacterium]
MKKFRLHLCSLFCCTAFTAAGIGSAQAQNAAELVRSDDPWFQQGSETLQKNLTVIPNTKPAKNIILFLGDGMGVSTFTAIRIYEGQLRGKSGEENVLAWETFPYSAFSKTYNTNQQVADSAGTATAFMSGVKAKAGVIGVSDKSLRADCESSKEAHVASALELAETAGMATGVVSTARITHATPAAAYAHGSERNWEDDKDMPDEAKAAGCVDFARQLIEFPYGDGVNVAMGGGRRSFLPGDMADPEDEGKTGERQDGRNLTQEWLDKYPNSAYVWNQEQFNAVDPATTDHLLGLFNRSHMAYEADRAKDKGGEPSLAEMTEKAIQTLQKNPEGFFLLVEGGRIDHGNHASNAYRMLNDGVAFNEAVKKALELTDAEETLIIVTADHSHVLTISGYPQRGNPILGKVVETDGHGLPKNDFKLAGDGKPYTTLSYANGSGAWESKDDNAARPDLTEVDTTDPDYIQQAAIPRGSETHAGEDVGIFAQGPKAYLFRGVVEQNYIFHVMDYAASLRERAAQTSQ